MGDGDGETSGTSSFFSNLTVRGEDSPFRRCVRLRRLGGNQKMEGDSRGAKWAGGLRWADDSSVCSTPSRAIAIYSLAACPFDCHRLYPDQTRPDCCPALRRCPLQLRSVTLLQSTLLLLLLLLASSAAACDPRLLRAGPVDSFEVFEKRFLVFQNPALVWGSMRSLQGSTTSAG